MQKCRVSITHVLAHCCPGFPPQTRSAIKKHQGKVHWKTYIQIARSSRATHAAFGGASFGGAALVGGACIAGVALYIAHIPVLGERASEQLGS